MTFLLSFFDIIATLVTAYLKILAPLLAIYLILYQLASLFYSQLPSILSYYSTGKWRYLKGYDRNSVRKLLVISALMGILFSLLMYVLPREYLQNDLMFYRYTLLSVLILVAMFIFYRVGNSYHLNKLFPLIRKF